MDGDAPASSFQRRSLAPRRSSLGAGPPAPAPAWLSEPGSKRWQHFQAALRLAVQRVARTWTYADFALCFPSLCEREPAEAGALFDGLRSLLQGIMEENAGRTFENYAFRPRLDEFDALAREARARTAPYTGPDAWRPDLHPRAAAHARTVPVLAAERDRLRAELDVVEEEAAALQLQLQALVRAKEAAQAETARVLDAFDENLAQWDARAESVGEP